VPSGWDAGPLVDIEAKQSLVLSTGIGTGDGRCKGLLPVLYGPALCQYDSENTYLGRVSVQLLTGVRQSR
jgi:hypothetical protein